MNKFIILAIALALGTPPTSGFEFRGLKTGFTEADVKRALDSYLECFHKDASSGSWCAAHNNRNLVVVINPEGLVWNVSYRFPTSLNESPESFAKALSAKYGKPIITTHNYQNKFGASFSGIEYAWYRGTQKLDVKEICDGETDDHCVQIIDTSLGPKSVPPQI